MRHEDAVLLSAFVDGELDGAELARVQGHLNACADCRAQTQALSVTKRLVAGAPRRAMPPELVAAIEARLERARSPLGSLRAFIRAPRYWAPAAALAVATLMTVTWVRLLKRDPDQYVPLEPLLAAHARYQAESLVPEDNLVAESYSTLTSTDAAPGDPDSE